MLTCVLVCIEKAIVFLRVRDVSYSPIQQKRKMLSMHQFQNCKTEGLPVIQNSKLKTQAPRVSTARTIILQEETQTAVIVFFSCFFFYRRAQPSEKLNKSLFSMHLCSDYMNFDL